MSHLSQNELATLTGLLSQREAMLKQLMRGHIEQNEDESFNTLTSGVPDVGDAASADLIIDIDHAKTDLELRELHDIVAARARMKNESYGICTQCEQEIEFARLAAYPTAKRCTLCQNLHEKTYATRSHSTL